MDFQGVVSVGEKVKYDSCKNDHVGGYLEQKLAPACVPTGYCVNSFHAPRQEIYLAGITRLFRQLRVDYRLTEGKGGRL